MNQEKAREFFSSYYEGAIEPGLKQALEQAMAKDPNIRDDYRAFENAYEDLGSLKFETIEIPFDLNDKILANLDRNIYERKRNQQPSWIMWLRNAAIAGVSCVAVLGAVLSLRNLTSKTASAGGFQVGSFKNALKIEPRTNREATVSFAPATTETLIIKEGLNGPERRRATVLEGKDMTTTLQNPNANATVFDLEVKSDKRSTLIALPGSAASTSKTGGGNLEEFARALASYYKVPVEIHVDSPTVNVTWDFQANDALNATPAALDASRYTIDWQTNNLLVISDSEA